MTINIFLRSDGASLAYSARPSQAGADPTPNIASAEFFKNTLRVFISLLLMPLKLRRTDHQSGNQTVLLRRRGIAVPCELLLEIRILQRLFNRRFGLVTRIFIQNRPRNLPGIFARLHC